MDFIRVSFGIVTFNRPECLKTLLNSFADIDIASSHEIVIIDNGSSDEYTHSIITEFKSVYKRGDVRVCLLDHNVGFPAAWTILEHIMRGEYRVMMQDDTVFHKRNPQTQFDDLLSYMAVRNLYIMSICSEGEGTSPKWLDVYSDWPHIEHSSLRRLVGDYPCYPRQYRTLYDQGITFEPAFNRQLENAGIKIAIYPKLVATLQRNGSDSFYQTLAHGIPDNLSEADKSKIWDNPVPKTLDEMNVNRWKS